MESLTSDRHIDLLLSTEVAFLQSNIGHQNLFYKKTIDTPEQINNFGDLKW